MIERYPSQDLSDSLEGFLWDFEQLAVKHSLAAVREALGSLRIRPGQQFFPRPDEVASEIERGVELRMDQNRQRRFLAQTDKWEADFWEWVDSRLSDDDAKGMTEQQFLDTVKQPGFTNRKAREVSA